MLADNIYNIYFNKKEYDYSIISLLFSRNISEFLLDRYTSAFQMYIKLIELLKDRMKDKNISLSDHHGIEADYLEAVAFAFLAKKTLRKEPGNIKSVTGANDDVILGGIYLA